MYHDELGLEALFKIPGHFIYVQYLSDDPEYFFDYTIYDNDFNDLDGGVIGTDPRWDLRRAAIEIIADTHYIGGLNLEGTPRVVNLDKYSDFIYG